MIVLGLTNKHNSSERKYINYGQEKFYVIDTWPLESAGSGHGVALASAFSPVTSREYYSGGNDIL